MAEITAEHDQAQADRRIHDVTQLHLPSPQLPDRVLRKQRAIGDGINRGFALVTKRPKEPSRPRRANLEGLQRHSRTCVRNHAGENLPGFANASTTKVVCDASRLANDAPAQEWESYRHRMCITVHVRIAKSAAHHVQVKLGHDRQAAVFARGALQHRNR
jgi:hypothetical protein